VSGRIFIDTDTPLPPTLSFFASSIAFIMASRDRGGSGAHPRREDEVEMRIRLHKS
jgi:hypothetical protein